jgi:hypothetical protein
MSLSLDQTHYEVDCSVWTSNVSSSLASLARLIKGLNARNLRV